MAITGISIVISTFNGQDTLLETLKSISNLKLPSVVVNLIIVNNNSTDQTSKILDDFVWSEKVHILFESRQGKNAALNTVLKHNHLLNDLIFFTDDDVILSSDILLTYQSYADSYNDFDIIGGKVNAKWPFPPPLGILKGIDLAVAFAITDENFGYSQGDIDPVKLHGPNFAIRKKILNENIRFNENVGPNKGNYIMGSETEFLYQLKDLGHQAFYCESAIVEHIIDEKQFSTTWLKNRAFKAGRSLIMHQEKELNFKRVHEFFGFPRWALVKRFKNLIKLFFTKIGSAKYYELIWISSHLRGYCYEYRQRFYTK